jgi:hypothetical protein
MQTQTRFWSRLGVLGVVYAALFVIANALIGNGPSAGASGATVVTYYRAHKASETAGVFVVAVAVIAFTFFLATLRHTLARTEESRLLASVVTAGGAVYAVGLLIMSALLVALVDAGHHDMVGAAQTLNVLSADAWVPVVVGLSVVALGTGVTALRTASLPTWLGWASIGLGILAVAGPAGGIAFLVAPLWALVVGIVILRSSRAQDPSAAPTTAAYVPAQG